MLQPLFADRQRLVERDHAGIKRVLYLEGRLERAENIIKAVNNVGPYMPDNIYGDIDAFLSDSDSPTSTQQGQEE